MFNNFFLYNMSINIILGGEKTIISAHELMNAAEIHDFGIEIVAKTMQDQGFTDIQVNNDLTANPQIVARVQ